MLTLHIRLFSSFIFGLETFLCESTANYLADLVSVAFWVFFFLGLLSEFYLTFSRFLELMPNFIEFLFDLL